MLEHAQVEPLLSQLCRELGFCLPPSERQRLVDAPPQDIDSFTEAVFVAEGMNPEMADRNLYRQVRLVVAKAFEGAALHLPNNAFKGLRAKRARP